MNNLILIIALAVTTMVIVVVIARVMRARVAKAEREPEHSSFTRQQGDAPRQNRLGTDH